MDHHDWMTAGALAERYVLRARVGAGRATTVYAAEDTRLQRPVAVKLFHDLPDEDGLTLFAAEAQVLAGLSHPALVTVYDVNLDAARPYMVMRLIDGGPLSGRIHQDGLRPTAVARLGAQLAEVLAYVHERGVVHGDVDATNVLVDEQGDGHLTGFGTDRGLGKPSGDIHALGMTLAECLPFDLGGEWRVVLTAMTDRDPDARPDAVRCAELLRNIAAGDTAAFPLPRVEPDPAELETARVEPAPKRIRPAYAGLTGMGLAVSALAVVMATGGTDTPGRPTGEQPRVEQPAEGTHAKPPAQTYPVPPDRQAVETSRPPTRDTSRATSTPPPSDPSPSGGNGENDNPGPGNGTGEGNGNGKGKDKGLLGDLLDGLG